MRLKKIPKEKLLKLHKIKNPNMTRNEFKKEEYKKLHHLSGTYLFVVKRNFEIDKHIFMKEVIGEFRTFEDKTYSIDVGVPPCNFSGRKIKCQRGEILYVGSAKDIYGRLTQHLFSKSITRNVSLKLGFRTRQYIKKYVDIYYTTKLKDEKEMRKQYGCIIGR